MEVLLADESTGISTRFRRGPEARRRIFVARERLCDSSERWRLLPPEIQTDKRGLIADVEEAVRQRGIGSDAVQDLRARDRTKQGSVVDKQPTNEVSFRHRAIVL